MNSFIRYNAFLSDKLSIDTDILNELSQTFYDNTLLELNVTKEVEKKVRKPRKTKADEKAIVEEKVIEEKKEIIEVEKKVRKPRKTKDTIVEAKVVVEKVVEVVEEKKEEKKISAKSKKILDIANMEKQKIIQTIQQRRNDIPIVKNQWGNYCHIGTSFVWNRETNEIIGRQSDNGNIIPLTNNNIELCIANNWKYLSNNIISKRVLETDSNSLYDSDISESEETDEG
jgi:hypothetical protein